MVFIVTADFPVGEEFAVKMGPMLTAQPMPYEYGPMPYEPKGMEMPYGQGQGQMVTAKAMAKASRAMAKAARPWPRPRAKAKAAAMPSMVKASKARPADALWSVAKANDQGQQMPYGQGQQMPRPADAL